MKSSFELSLPGSVIQTWFVDKFPIVKQSNQNQMVLDGSSPITPTDTVTIGHEAVGEIIDHGTSVTGFSQGDVIGYLNAYHACWSCHGCESHYGFCESKEFVMQGWGMDGFLQEYCIVDYHSAIKLPKGMDAKKAAPLFCAGITAYNAVFDQICGKASGWPSLGAADLDRWVTLCPNSDELVFTNHFNSG